MNDNQIFSYKNLIEVLITMGVTFKTPFSRHDSIVLPANFSFKLLSLKLNMFNVYKDKIKCKAQLRKLMLGYPYLTKCFISLVDYEQNNPPSHVTPQVTPPET